MIFTVIYHRDVLGKDIPKIGATWRIKIRDAIAVKLTTNPTLYGKPLRRSLKNYRKLRVGDYRVIFRIEGQQVKVFAIQHRSVIYDTAQKRIS